MSSNTITELSQDTKVSGLRARTIDEARAVLEVWDVQPLSVIGERTLRTISSRYMTKGFCHATHEQIAAQMTVAKSTAQRGIDEIEALEYIYVERTGAKRPNIITLAPGVKEALRIQHLERIRAGKQGYPCELEPTTLAPLVLHHRPKATPNKHIPAPPSSPKRTPATQASPGKKDEVTVACSEKEQASEATRTMSALGIKKRTIKELITNYALEQICRNLALQMPKDVKNPAGYVIAAIRADYAAAAIAQQDAQPAEIVATLVAEGVTPSVAALTVRVWPEERIRRNIELGEHLRANNPPGYLIEAIRSDFATARGWAKPGSEHAAIAALEKPRDTHREQIISTENPLPSRPPAPDPWLKYREIFSQIDQAEQAAFIRMAEAEPIPEIITLRKNVEQAPTPLMRQIQAGLLANAVRARAMELAGIARGVESVGKH